MFIEFNNQFVFRQTYASVGSDPFPTFSLVQGGLVGNGPSSNAVGLSVPDGSEIEFFVEADSQVPPAQIWCGLVSLTEFLLKITAHMYHSMTPLLRAEGLGTRFSQSTPTRHHFPFALSATGRLASFTNLPLTTASDTISTAATT